MTSHRLFMYTHFQVDVKALFYGKAYVLMNVALL